MSWDVIRLLAGLTIGVPFSARFQTEALREDAGFLE
jgi:hypothetical protein